MYAIGGTSSTRASQWHGRMGNVFSSLCSKLWTKAGLGVKKVDLLSNQTLIYLPPSAATCFFILEYNLDIPIPLFLFKYIEFQRIELLSHAHPSRLWGGSIRCLDWFTVWFYTAGVKGRCSRDLLTCCFTFWGISYPQSACSKIWKGK